MGIKNSSQDFQIKKEFIDLQLELKQFLEETEFFSLKDILKDPFIVHSIDDFVAAYREHNDVKHIKNVLKKLIKIKKKNLNLNDLIEKPISVIEEKKVIRRHKFEQSEFKNNFFELHSVKPKQELCKEAVVQIFKNHMKRLELIKKIIIKPPVLPRNYSTSSSHSHLIKKIEKSNENNQLPLQNKLGNEITTNMSFRNGISRSIAVPEKKMQNFPTTNVIRANRSPRLSSSINNPHEALISGTNQEKINSQGSSENEIDNNLNEQN